MRNASLDEFGGGAESDGEQADGKQTDDEPVEADPEDRSGPESGSATDGDTDEEEEAAGGDVQADEGTVEPAVSTLAWTPGGAACADCGEFSERRWRDDGDLVCPACKPW